jgi:hypothetical protein
LSGTTQTSSVGDLVFLVCNFTCRISYPYCSPKSGDSRKLFAPKLYYDMDCDVREVVIDQVEILEMVNSIAADWRTLVDGGDQDDLCSEHDIFMIRHQSMYLTCALQKFVDEASNISRWTWQQCIQHSIGLMNDIGGESYSHWRPLAKWHRRLTYSPKGTSIKSSAPKNCLPPFFIENPDAMDAFKKRGVSILKELLVERMHMYMLKTLIPTTMARGEQGIEDTFDNSQGDDELLTPPSLELLQETKSFHQGYRLLKVSIATVVRWMHTTGFFC